jgi:hypothetical protein
MALGARVRLDPAGGARRTARHAMGLALAIGPGLLTGFDVAPAFACAIAIYAAVYGRFGWAGIALGLGGAAKIYPLLLVPALACAAIGGGKRRDALRVVSGAVGACALACAPFAFWAWQGGVADLTRHFARPIEIESVLATPLLFGHATAVADFATTNLIGPRADTAAALSGVLLFGMLGLVCVLTWRTARSDLRSAIISGPLLAVLGTLCVSRVLFPPFLIWLVPLVLAIPGGRGNVLTLLIALAATLTQIFYPYFFQRLARLETGFTIVLAMRNAVLVLTLVLACLSLGRAPLLPRRWRPPRLGG